MQPIKNIGRVKEYDSEETYNENKFQIINKGPFDSIAVFFVFLVCGPAFDEGFSNERVDWRSRGRRDGFCLGSE